MSRTKLLFTLGITTLASVGCSVRTEDAAGASTPAADAGPDTNLPLGQIDRMGRPPATRSRQEDDDFGADAGDAAHAISGEGVDDHLKFFNTLGPTAPATKWTSGGNATPLSVTPRRFDILLVDPNKPFPVDNKAFLTIEDTLFNGAGAQGGMPYTSCGGRVPNENVVDKILSYLVLRRFEGICTGLSAPSKPAGFTFPYLAPPR